MDNCPIPFPNRAACRRFIETCYEGQLTRCGQPFAQQALRIAELADGYLTDYFMYTVGLILPMQRLRVDSAYCGGLLCAVLQIQPRACFEYIVELANLETANLIGAITPDRRLPGPQRNRDLVGRLYESSLDAQVLKLAELRVMVEEVAAVFPRLKRAEAKQKHKDWLIECQGVLAALRKIRDDESFETDYKRLQDTLGSLIKTCDNAAQHERLKANIAKNNAARNSAKT